MKFEKEVVIGSFIFNLRKRNDKEDNKILNLINIVNPLKVVEKPKKAIF